MNYYISFIGYIITYYNLQFNFNFLFTFKIHE